MENEDEIIGRCLEGDEEAFRELVEAYRERIFWVAYGNVGDREVAKDITQDVLVSVYSSLHQFDRDRSFSTWLFAIVRNRCIDWLRKHGSDDRVSLDYMDYEHPVDQHPAADVHNRELQKEVHRILQRIPEKYRMVLTLRELEGMSCKKIAEMIDCTPGTTRWRVHRARKLFRQAWEDEFASSRNPLM